jgi:hypothetical protein
MGRKIQYARLDLSTHPLNPPRERLTQEAAPLTVLEYPCLSFPTPATPERPKVDGLSKCAHDKSGTVFEHRNITISALDVDVRGGTAKRDSSLIGDEAGSTPQQDNKQPLGVMSGKLPPSLSSNTSDKTHSTPNNAQATPDVAKFRLRQHNMQHHPLPSRPPPLSLTGLTNPHVDLAPASSDTLPLRPPPLSLHGGTNTRTALATALPSTLPPRPTDGELMYARRPIRHTPIVGKVYYMSDGRYFPDSIIHRQKRQDGFFKHPILVIGVEDHFVHFYALTKAVPFSIGELNMCLRIGNTTADEGCGFLKLAYGSPCLKTESWVNLEQQFHVEWQNLDEWAVDVRIDVGDLWKLWKRVQELEAEQNRYIYKPISRDMSLLHPGTVIMLCNDRRSATLGAPVIILENQYPRFRFLRIKLFDDNIHFNPASRRLGGNPRHMCLEVSKHPHMGHDGTPVMLIEPDAPEMREPSYLEVLPQMGSLDMCKTWCWPPVVVRQQSLQVLSDYMWKLAALTPGPLCTYTLS